MARKKQPKITTEDMREWFATPMSTAESIDPDAADKKLDIFDEWHEREIRRVRNETLHEINQKGDIEPEVVSNVFRLAVKAHRGDSEGLHEIRAVLSRLSPQWQAKK